MSDNRSSGAAQADKSENSVGSRILAQLKRLERDRNWLAAQTGIAPQTISDYVNGGIKNADKAVQIARALGVSVDWLLTGAPDASTELSDRPEPSVVQVPVYDVPVAAGGGRLVDRFGEPYMWWPLSREWAQANRLPLNSVAMFVVSGASQEPELSDNDLIAVDLSDTKIREGLYVVRLDDLFVVKHIQREGRNRINLVSRNSVFPPVTIDLSEQANIGDSGFEVIGRAVWASKML